MWFVFHLQLVSDFCQLLNQSSELILQIMRSIYLFKESKRSFFLSHNDTLIESWMMSITKEKPSIDPAQKSWTIIPFNDQIWLFGFVLFFFEVNHQRFQKNLYKAQNSQILISKEMSNLKQKQSNFK